MKSRLTYVTVERRVAVFYVKHSHNFNGTPDLTGGFKGACPPRGWLGSRVVSVLDSGAEGSGFKSQRRRCPVTVLRKPFTYRASVHQAPKLVAALLRVASLTAGLAESNGGLQPGL